MKSLRIAFLTNEFVTEKKKGGGLASYLNRITQALKALGHEPEVFVRRAGNTIPDIVEHNGIRVEHVAVAQNWSLRLLAHLDQKFFQSPWGGAADYLGTALGLARALERRHKEQPFDFVQSTNLGASGLFVRHMANRPHLIRLSSHRSLWWRTDGVYGYGAKSLIWLERTSIRRADIAYAPSRFLADYCRQTGWRNDVRVLRPPLFIETKAASELPSGLPAKFLVHFGQIGTRKGSDIVAKALCEIWPEEPEFKMVWAGKTIQLGDFERCHRLWGNHAHNVFWLGPIPKNHLYAILQNSVASVLPSRVDNLPNTVIESLTLGIPVIGSDGASIDELVESGVNGELVPIGDHKALASAMLRAWRGESKWNTSEFRRPTILDDMTPKLAAQNLLALAGL